MSRYSELDDLQGFVIFVECENEDGMQNYIATPENGGPLYSTAGRAQGEITRQKKYYAHSQAKLNWPEKTWSVLPAKIVVEFPPEDTSRDWAKVDLT